MPLDYLLAATIIIFIGSQVMTVRASHKQVAYDQTLTALDQSLSYNVNEEYKLALADMGDLNNEQVIQWHTKLLQLTKEQDNRLTEAMRHVDYGVSNFTDSGSQANLEHIKKTVYIGKRI